MNLAALFPFVVTAPFVLAQGTKNREKEAEFEYRIAVVALGKSDLESAEEHLRNAVAILPDNALIHYNLGIVQSKRGDHQGAKASLTHALQLGLPRKEEAIVTDDMMPAITYELEARKKGPRWLLGRWALVRDSEETKRGIRYGPPAPLTLDFGENGVTADTAVGESTQKGGKIFGLGGKGETTIKTELRVLWKGDKASQGRFSIASCVGTQSDCKGTEGYSCEARLARVDENEFSLRMIIYNENYPEGVMPTTPLHYRRAAE